MNNVFYVYKSTFVYFVFFNIPKIKPFAAVIPKITVNQDRTVEFIAQVLENCGMAADAINDLDPRDFAPAGCRAPSAAPARPECAGVIGSRCALESRRERSREVGQPADSRLSAPRRCCVEGG